MKNEVLSDELLAIDAIYPSSMQLSAGSDNTYIVKVPETSVEFFLSFDQSYPASTPKLSTVIGIERTVVESALESAGGNEVLFSVISAVQEHLDRLRNTARGGDEVAPEDWDMVAEDTSEGAVEWTIGEPVHDRKSTMLGRACKVTSREELESALRSVEQDKKLQKASHPCIWACRFKTAQGTMLQENDDDGETAAGSRLAFLLEVTGAEDVLVVVSRWFGGVLLGDIRFKHISTAARDALDRGGFLTTQDTNKTSKKGTR